MSREIDSMVSSRSELKVLTVIVISDKSSGPFIASENDFISREL